jgi:hypothetical protein
VTGLPSLARDRRQVGRWAASLPALGEDLSGLARSDRPHVLIVSLTQDAEQIQLESILAKAMQARGSRVTVLVFADLEVRRRFRALGVRGLVYYEDFVPARLQWEPEVGPLLAGVDDLSAYRDLVYRDARVGRHALSTVVRERHEPRIELDEPGVRAALERHVRHGMEGARVGERLLDEVSPDLLLMIERGYVGVGAIFDVALERGLPVVQLQSSHRDDAFTLKRYTLDSRDIQPRSISPETWRMLLVDGMTPERERRLEEEIAERETGKWFLAKRVKHSDRRRAPDQVRRDLGLDPDRKVAVLFSHVLWDASMFYGTDLYPDQGKWFAETLRVAAADDRVQWLVKLHPALLWKLRHDEVGARPVELDIVRDVVGDLPAHMRLLMPDDDVATADLFSFIDAGVTIRGTVGIELPCLGIPALTAGTSDYSDRGFTVDASSIADYEANVRGVAELPRLSDHQVRLARLYAYGIFCRRPWRFSTFSLDYLPVDEAGDTLEHRMTVYASTPEELRSAPDLERFARWAVETDDADYVGPE